MRTLYECLKIVMRGEDHLLSDDEMKQVQDELTKTTDLILDTDIFLKELKT